MGSRGEAPSSALSAAEPGEIAQLTVTTRRAAIPGGTTATTTTAEEWSFGGQWRSVTNSPAGHPVYEEGGSTSSVYTVVSYLTRTWVSVLERRSEIGLRRALGATRRHIAEQFLAEALLLSVLGGLAGTVIGGLATASYALSQHWQVRIPALALCGGVGAALAIGAIAGLYPSMRAACLSPAEALRTV